MKNPEKTAHVDQLVDENGARIALKEDTAVGDGPAATGPIGATGPTGWWRIGLAALAVLIAIVLLVQLLGGGTPAPTP